MAPRRKRRGTGGSSKRIRDERLPRVSGSDGTHVRRPKTIEDLYGGGDSGNLLRGEFTDRTDIHAKLQRRHARGLSFIQEGVWVRGGHEWAVPYGVRVALGERLYWAQLANRYPFYVTWRSPKNGKRMKRNFSSMPAAIDFISSKVQYIDHEASVVSKHGFYIPRHLMGKFPRKGKSGKLYYWCPRCMQPRRFVRHPSMETFFADKKFWNEEKGYYEWKNVRLARIACTVCHISNQDHKFRASNQPVEKVVLRGSRKRRRRNAKRRR